MIRAFFVLTAPDIAGQLPTRRRELSLLQDDPRDLS